MQNEKVTLVFLIVAALVMVMVSIYLGVNSQFKSKELLNSKIHVIHTGGEIENNFKENYEKHKSKMGQFDLDTYDPPMSSSDIVPKDWNVIAEDIGKKYHGYDAFIVVCGRDTLTYTASALSFMLENLNKPVILTDGEVALALLLASTTKIPEVMVASRGKLLRGCRTVNNSTEYFTSPNYPPLEPYNALTPPQDPMQIKFVSGKVRVVVVKIFPGMDEKYLHNAIGNTEVHGVVFETYGVGRCPTNTKFLEAIGKLAKRGVVMVAVSQCNEISKPDVDIRLLEAGVLSGYDMTVTAAYTKLCFLLGNVKDKKLIGQLMEQTFRGEMSVNIPTIQ
jgi:L-asparaginase